jgi:hydroxypyruvate isomerase
MDAEANATAGRPGAPGSWCLRYASHLGYRSPDAPLFPHSVPTPGPLAQIDLAAELGFAGVQFALARSSSVVEQIAVGARLRRRGLATGCMLYAPFDVIRTPYLGRTGPAAREEFLQQIRAALQVARHINSRQIVVLAAADPDISRAVQADALIGHLRDAAELAHAADVVLELEGIQSAVLPPMILRRLDDVVEVLQRVGSPNVRLIYDTAHVEAIDGDAVGRLSQVFDYMDILQIADHPGRFEPGSGGIDFEAILTEAARRGFRGLVELEHGWSERGLEGERRGLESLRELDGRVRRYLAQGVGARSTAGESPGMT